MFADEVDYVVGVDPHRDIHVLVVVDARSGGQVVERRVAADGAGYVDALGWVQANSVGRRAWAIEGTGSYGAGLARFLVEQGERVVEVSRLRRERRWQPKTDTLDALRTARSVLGDTRPAAPRAGGERDALRALMVARTSAVIAKKACLCQSLGEAAVLPQRCDLISVVQHHEGSIARDAFHRHDHSLDAHQSERPDGREVNCADAGHGRRRVYCVPPARSTRKLPSRFRS